ncbi:hypothetical protein VCNHCC004A_000229A, partial [Vibrio cholerae O1 str. NHCC-004A]
MIALLGAL